MLRHSLIYVTQLNVHASTYGYSVLSHGIENYVLSYRKSMTTSTCPSSFDYERYTEYDVEDVDNGREAIYDLMFDPEYNDRYDNADY